MGTIGVLATWCTSLELTTNGNNTRFHKPFGRAGTSRVNVPHEKHHDFSVSHGFTHRKSLTILTKGLSWYVSGGGAKVAMSEAAHMVGLIEDARNNG